MLHFACDPSGAMTAFTWNLQTPLARMANLFATTTTWSLSATATATQRMERLRIRALFEADHAVLRQIRGDLRIRHHLGPVAVHEAAGGAGLQRLTSGVEAAAVVGIALALRDTGMSLKAELGEIGEAVFIRITNGIRGITELQPVAVLPHIAHAIAIGVIIKRGGGGTGAQAGLPAKTPGGIGVLEIGHAMSAGTEKIEAEVDFLHVEQAVVIRIPCRIIRVVGIESPVGLTSIREAVPILIVGGEGNGEGPPDKVGIEVRVAVHIEIAARIRITDRISAIPSLNEVWDTVEITIREVYLMVIGLLLT